MNILLTGQPHVGKTTLLNRILKDVEQKVGFVTNEILESGERVGYDLTAHDGRKATLAHVKNDSAIRVSKYGVSVENLEMLLPSLQGFSKDDLLYLDEIGQMELYSEQFKELVRSYLDAPNDFVGTISAVYNDQFTHEVKNRTDVKIFIITPENRDEIYDTIKELL